MRAVASIGGRQVSLASALYIARACRSLGILNSFQLLRVVTAGRTYLEVVMRMLLKAVFETAAANEVIGKGQGAETTRQMVERLQPEAFYAFGEDGQRAVLMVFDMADPSQIPALTEPMFQQGNAKVTLTPCMNLEDLQKGFEELASQMASTEG